MVNSMLGMAVVYLDASVATRDSSILLEAAKNFLSGLQVVRVLGGPIYEVGGFDKLWPQKMLTPMHLEIRCERFGNKVMSLHNLIEDLMTFNGWLNVSHKDLKAWPKCAQGINEMLGSRVRPMHVDILHDRTLETTDKEGF